MNYYISKLFDIIKNMENPKDPDKEHFQRMAKSMSSDPDTIESIIHRFFGWKNFNIKRIIAGVGNEVYQVVNLKKESKVILRINHKGNSRFKLEQWAMNKVADQGVPVPQILNIGEYKTNSKTLGFSIQSHISGDNLSDVLDEGPSKAELEKYGEKAGVILAKIHKVTTKGWGKFTEPCVAEHDSLEASMQQRSDEKDLINAAKKIDLDIKIIKEAVEIIDKITTEESPHLIHTDYAPKHIFIRNDEICGVIDFEICMSGTASMDINRWRSQDSRINIEYLINGYEQIKALHDNFWEEMFIVQVHSALRTMLFHASQAKNLKEAKRAAREVQTLVDNHKPLHK